MKITCPACQGKKAVPADRNLTRACGVCREKGEVVPMKESIARSLFPGNFDRLDKEGWQSTAQVDQATNLMVVILKEEAIRLKDYAE